MTYDYDLFTIGGGSGGVRASRVAASFGAKVALAEERYLGGTCVNVGCIPKKLMVYASEFSGLFHEAASFGWTVGASSFDWRTLIENKDREIARLNGVYRKLLENSGATIIEGRAKIVDPHTIEIAGRRVSARYILVATGGWPTVPELPGCELAITSNEIFHLERLPERIVIVGGGYIGVEFAGILHGLGCKVTQIYRGGLFLRGFDDDLRAALAAEMVRRGIDLRFKADVAKIERADDALKITLKDGSTIAADLCMFATGRHPNTSGIGFEEVGVKLDWSGAVAVDEYSQSSIESIYAIGDCTNRLNLTPVAIAEGRAVAETLFNNNPTAIDRTNIPSCVFSQPNLATVGLTEAMARERCGEVDIYRSVFRPLRLTLGNDQERTVMKLVVERATDRVVGCHMLGADAGEIIQGLAIAMKCGATKADFDSTIGIHPTAAEEFVTMREKS
jgi:glutathione reductase (NADPH)